MEVDALCQIPQSWYCPVDSLLVQHTWNVAYEVPTTSSWGTLLIILLSTNASPNRVSDGNARVRCRRAGTENESQNSWAGPDTYLFCFEPGNDLDNKACVHQDVEPGWACRCCPMFNVFWRTALKRQSKKRSRLGIHAYLCYRIKNHGPQ